MNHHVYLASASPRRKELLEQIGVRYTVIKPYVDESKLNDVDPQAYTQRITIAKALYVNQIVKQQKLENRPIIAADTAIVIGQDILGKPKDKADATLMLKRLSDSTHQVYSSTCVLKNSTPEVITQISDVTFRAMFDEEIEEYWNCGEPADKAGAYGIQGFGAKFIKHLNGSYSGVMGLPLYELMCLLDNRPF